MNTKQRVLALLKESDTILSGEKIAQTIGLSRTAIWKAIKELEKQGYVIEHHSNGYSYLASDVLEANEIAFDSLSSSSIHIKEQTESTMKDAKLATINQQQTPLLFLAETQTAGHGRFGRPFFSPKGQIYMSLLLHPNQVFQDMPQYTLLAAVAVALAIDEVTEKTSEIKWVNDIYLDGKKVCGILSEATSDFESGRISYVTIGMGLNFSLANEEFPIELRQKAGALFQGNAPVTRNHFIKLVWENFFDLVEGLPDDSYLRVYREKSFVLGKLVSFTQQGITYSGKARAITDFGELQVDTNEGLKTLSSGEISLTSIE